VKKSSLVTKMCHDLKVVTVVAAVVAAIVT